MRILALLAVAAIAGLIAAWTQQRRLLYFPGPDPGRAPAGWNELTYPTSDGLRLNGWFRAAAPDVPLVLMLPGNGGNRAGRVPLGNALVERGFGVLLVDYRGYGGNPGSPSERGLLEDARSAYRAVRDADPGAAIAYLGESLGAAVAIALAAEEPPTALILISPFTSLHDVGRVHYPLAPTALFRESYPSRKRCEQGLLERVPTLVIAGGGDTVVPVEQSRAIASAAGAELYEVGGADHNDPAIRTAPELVDRISAFLGRALNGADDS